MAAKAYRQNAWQGMPHSDYDWAENGEREIARQIQSEHWSLVAYSLFIAITEPADLSSVVAEEPRRQATKATAVRAALAGAAAPPQVAHDGHQREAARRRRPQHMTPQPGRRPRSSSGGEMVWINTQRTGGRRM